MEESCNILLIEPFYVGSHKQLIDLLHREIPGTQLYCLPGKKWQWKARTSALWFSQAIPRNHKFKTLFATSVLNMAELLALRPELAVLHKVVYFHENQLIYPVRKQQDRDFQFGYNEILTSMVADVVLFNSRFNMDSFLSNINSHLKLIPDHRPKSLVDQIKPKCHVVHFPIVFPETGNKCTENCLLSKDKVDVSVNSNANMLKSFEKIGDNSDNKLSYTDQKNLMEDLQNENEGLCSTDVNSGTDGDIQVGENHSMAGDCDMKDETPVKKSRFMEQTRPLHIVWPHRWEHDKDPETFFRVLTHLHNDGLDFRISVLGERFSEEPDVFEESRRTLEKKILNWGYLPSKGEYYQALKCADCVVSTAKHEFFGVAMLEAVHHGCYPLCPNQLVYPEIFPKECLYNTEQQLYKKLREFCKKPFIPRSKTGIIDTSQFSWKSLQGQFLKYLLVRRK